MLKVTITFHNPNPNTIWNRLAARLGREPSNEEAAEEVRRILREARTEQARGAMLTRVLRADKCPSDHWNDGTDHCADCGAFLG